MNSLYERYPALRHVVTMLSSSSVSQIIPFITIPILSRIYTPTDFGIYEIYYSLMTILVVIPNLRLENAMLLEKDDNKSFNLLFFIFISNLFFFISFLILFFIFKNQILSFYDIHNYQKLIFLVPISIFISSLYNLFSLFLVRFSLFKSLALSKIFVSVFNAIIQIYLGFLFLGSYGLIYGNIIAYFFGLLLILIPCWNLIKNYKIQISKDQIFVLLKKYKSFVYYTLTADFISNFSQQLPTIMIGKHFSSFSLGFYSIARRIVGLPLSFISGAVQDVYKKEAIDEFNQTKKIINTFMSTFILLSFLGLLIVIFLFLFGEFLIISFLGDQWAPGVEIVQILSVLFSIRFVSGTLNYVFLIKSKQILDFIFQIIQLIFVFLSFKFASLLEYNFTETIILYTILLSIYSIINLSFSHKYAK